MKNLKFLRSITVLCLVLILFSAPNYISASNAEENTNSEKSTVITETLNLSDARKNLSGPGYYWLNPQKTLTFKNLTIRTEEDYGIKVPSGATIILEGENHITAQKYGLSCSGGLTFKGSGSLIVEAGEYAFHLYSSNVNNKIKILEGKYTLSGGKAGICSPDAEFSIIDGQVKILPQSSSEGLAISGNIINILGGDNDFSGSVHAEHLIKINGANLKITSENKAINSENLLDINNEKILAGFSADEISEVESYNDESCLEMTSTYKKDRGSIIFGENTKSYVDFIIMIAAIAVICAAVLIPTLLKRHRTRALYEKLENEKNEKK